MSRLAERRITSHVAVAAVVLTLAVCMTIMPAQVALAGIITGVTVSGPGGFAASVVIATTSPGNDNTVPASPNSIDITKTMTSVAMSPTDPGTAYLDFTFSVADSGTVTEYFVTETVTNGSGVTWLDFHQALGFPVADAFPIFGAEPFTTSGPADGLGFDAPGFDPLPLSPAFPTVTPGPENLSWLSAGFPDPGATTFTFSLDLPDFSAATMPAAAAIGGGYEFRVRQWATITAPAPVPAASPLGLAILMMLTLTGLALLYRRRQVG